MAAIPNRSSYTFCSSRFAQETVRAVTTKRPLSQPNGVVVRDRLIHQFVQFQDISTECKNLLVFHQIRRSTTVDLGGSAAKQKLDRASGKWWWWPRDLLTELLTELPTMCCVDLMFGD